MTINARKVLDDCRVALKDLNSSEAKGHTFRTRWVSAIALLRAVGAVLDKRDSEIDKYYRNAIKDAHDCSKKTKPEPRIFWDFIVAERNNILKVYEFGTKGVLTIRPGTMSYNPSTGDQKIVAESQETTYENFLIGGPFNESTPAEAISKAIDWWINYLDKIDREAERLKELDT